MVKHLLGEMLMEMEITTKHGSFYSKNRILYVVPHKSNVVKESICEHKLYLGSTDTVLCKSLV